ncbi:tripartite motif-containing protein 16-like protein [Lates japonicus]|uniref:Tripartite motif-containing protein 16-like protein n=1 Tax=Lates japonicus TaxID=270547 RepID=A0AAD3MZ30_LATJO|nr:tripartite motif-containing protein 16-like protein [Lates japonicus]
MSRIPVQMNRLCCRICSGVLRDPATVPCGHNFCMRCIQSCWDRDKRDNCPCRCPECGHMFPTTPQLIKNTTLAELVRDTEKFDSGTEKTRQRRLSGESPHAPKRPRRFTETGKGSALCLRHRSPLDVYCCTDERTICAVCASVEHGGHRIGCVGEERRRKQEELKNMQTRSKQILQKQTKKLKNLGKTLDQIQEEARRAEDYCEAVVVSVIKSLQKHYLSVRELIGAQEEVAAAQVHTSVRTLTEKIEEMKEREAELDRLAQTDSDVRFLQEWPSLQRLCEEDRLHLLHEEDPLVPFRITKRAVEQLGEQLEEICEKEFALITETVFPGAVVTVTEQDVEPTTRAEFLRYARELTLDPTTAHKDLVVSEGDKKVKLSPQLARNPAIHYPERFVHRRQVLCREGMQAERCYYEIEVEGGKAEIALAYRRINRKSRGRLSAFGGNKNSWSLDRSANYSVSHNSGSVQLTTSPGHNRIGVYLKFKEGTLMFYEVSDCMKFLYRAEATFTEPLCPGFWLGEKCCIRICDLR